MDSSDFKDILISQIDGRVGVIHLNRPKARNAIRNNLLNELAQALSIIAENNNIRCVVITGSDKLFAAGADIKEMAELDSIGMLHNERPRYWEVVKRFPKPIIAAVNGYALGAGCELAMHADIIIAGKNAQFGQPEINLGIIPGAGGTQRLIRCVGESIEKRYNPLVNTLFTLELPVICAVNGIAAGAGANIALSCDIVLAARSAYFLQAFCKLGLIPDSGGTWQLPNNVGRAKAMGMALLGEKISAEQAEQWGLIWQCLDDEKLANVAQSMANHLAQQPTQGLAYIKRAINHALTNSLNNQLRLEQDLQTLAGRTDDYTEGVTAFLEKRTPNFMGK